MNKNEIVTKTTGLLDKIKDCHSIQAAIAFSVGIGTITVCYCTVKIVKTAVKMLENGQEICVNAKDTTLSVYTVNPTIAPIAV